MVRRRNAVTSWWVLGFALKATGVLENLVGTFSVCIGYDVPVVVPIIGGPQIVGGSTWYFQLWMREDAGWSNFSNGLSVIF